MNFNIDNNDFEKETNIKVVGVGGGRGKHRKRTAIPAETQ